MVALIEIFGYISANLIALANGPALGVHSKSRKAVTKTMLTPTL